MVRVGSKVEEPGVSDGAREWIPRAVLPPDLPPPLVALGKRSTSTFNSSPPAGITSWLEAAEKGKEHCGSACLHGDVQALQITEGLGGF